MPGDEQKSINRAGNHDWSAIISLTMSLQLALQTTVSHENKIPKCFSCPGDCKDCLKRLSEAHTTQTKPGPSHGRPDRQQLADQEADKDKRDTKMFL